MKCLRFSTYIGCCALLGGCLSGCASLSNTLESLPRDQSGQSGWTSQIQREQVLVVGVSQAEKQDQAVATQEKKIIAQLANRLGARVKWREGNAHTLLNDLEARRIPLVAAQLPSDSPFAEKLGFSKPFYKRATDNIEYSIAVAPGENRLLLLLDQIIEDDKIEDDKIGADRKANQGGAK